MQFSEGTGTGLGVYADNLAAALRRRPDIELVEFRDTGYDVWRFDRRIFWDQVRAPLLARRSRADIVHFTGGTLPLWTPHPCVLTVHDLAWLHGAVAGRAHSRLYFGAIQSRLARRADRIATDTEVARSGILETLRVPPSKVAVTGAGVDESWFAVPRLPDDPPFLLNVGTVEKRKDLITAVRALAALPNYKLISAGPHTPYAAKVMQAAVEAGVQGRVELRGFVDDASLKSLYARASALLFPSRYEGFGLPPLQALAAGLPVVASDIPVLREVLGASALFARPGDPESFAERLRTLSSSNFRLHDLVKGGREQARQFTWEQVAERTAHLYRAIIQDR
jgi:glycosyltransferase involved in cell wall biosynthesis